ncbi:MAG: hydroxyisourate hydrolase [Deltaproteobacteria bacterium]|nr:hydroxyisourate hydrolase [Deltaproteobacteria bacterium]MCW5807652.1 hydroxyisourate hydrolase [Deltaproteobacteria bacterium]
MITTHVLDTAAGRPGAGIAIALERLDGTAWVAVGHGATDDDGRLRTLTPPGPVAEGTYRIRFDTGAYLASRGQAGFFPVVEIQFTVADGAQHYHVPLLLSPFGYSTYRGS